MSNQCTPLVVFNPVTASQLSVDDPKGLEGPVDDVYARRVAKGVEGDERPPVIEGELEPLYLSKGVAPEGNGLEAEPVLLVGHAVPDSQRQGTDVQPEDR